METIQVDKYFSYTADTTEKAKITIDAGTAGKRVSERLFGLFTEHLGRNVYGGAWAQIIENGGFARYHEDHEPMDKHQIPPLLEVTKARLERLAREFDMPALPEYEKFGLAPYWALLPETQAKCTVQTDDNGRYWQEVVVAEGAEGALETPIYLPLHRVSSYEFSLNLQIPQGRIPSAIKIQVLTKGNETIGEECILLHPHVKAGRWITLKGIMNVNGAGVEKGAELKFRIYLLEPGQYWLADASLFPTDNLHGWDPDVVQLLKEARVSVLRFPGGNFASGYNWQAGIGPRQLRPEKPNPAWPIWESNQVGTDEWLTLCELINAEPMICVNAGSGSAEDAANWVRYCNDPVDTKWGQKRAANGHPAPYNVKLWEVGNELWGDFQINWATPEEYGRRFAEFSAAMLAADPTIELIAVGGSNPSYAALPEHGYYAGHLGAAYAEHAVKESGPSIWAIAEHAVMGGGFWDLSPQEIYEELLAQTHYIGRILSDNVEQLKALGGEHILVAQTEQMVAVPGDDNPSDESLTAAIVWAGFMNWFLRSDGLVPLFTRSALINHGDFLNKVREIVYPLPGYWGQHLYANQPGRLPAAVHYTGPVFSVGGRRVRAAENIPWLDVVSLLGPDRKNMSVLIVNRHPQKSIETEIKCTGFSPKEQAQVRVLAGPEISSHNKWYEPDRIKPYTFTVNVKPEAGYTLNIPPHAIAVMTFSKAE